MIDQVIIGLYLFITLIVGLIVGRDTNNISDFAIGKRKFSTIVLVSTIFASVVDGNGTLGLAEAVFTQGPLYCVAFLGIIFSYLGLAFFIAPKFDPFLGLMSSGDILGSLYGKKAKIFMGFATVFESTMLTGVQILAMTHLIQYFFAIPSSFAALGSSAIILIYSLRGGIRAVTATDVFQFGILIIAIPLMCGIALAKIGGFDGLREAITHAHTRAEPDIDYLKHLAIFISFALPALFPLTIQRMLMAKNTKQITSTFFITGILSFPFYIIVGIIAICTLVLLPNVNPNFVFPALINEVIPIGPKGFVIAGLLAVFMSSIDSSLNVASIAITHDIYTPLVKEGIKEKVKLRIARTSSILIAALATFSALCFDNIFGMMFVLLCVSNSAFFPGYLIGLLGFRPGVTGFWTGVITAITAVLFFTFVLDLFELYTGLIAIILNISVLLIFHWKEKRFAHINKKLAVQFGKNVHLVKPISSFLSLKEPIYYITFAVSCVINSVVPFFLLSTEAKIYNSPYLLLYFASAVMAFLVIFREAWWEKFGKLYLPLIYSLLTVSLPGLSFLMCLHTGCEALWILNLIVSFFMLLILADKKTLIGSLVGGFILAAILHYVSGPLVYPQVTALGKWSIFSHLVSLALCLFIFRKQEVENYRFLSGKLAHEAARSLSSLSASAELLRLKLPELIRGYEWAYHNGYDNKPINPDVLEEIKDLPSRLQNMGQRTAKTVGALLGKIETGIDQRSNLGKVDILSCVKEAMNDPSIAPAIRSKIVVSDVDNFFFLGDHAQIIQVIINLFENAGHAIAKKTDGTIRVWSLKNSLFIKDNGIGISKKNLPSIFDEYFTTKETLGQGLAFCRQVMAEHNGAINCESEENSYTQFELSFPRWS